MITYELMLNCWIVIEGMRATIHRVEDQLIDAIEEDDEDSIIISLAALMYMYEKWDNLK